MIRRGGVEHSVPGGGALEAGPTFELRDLAKGEYVYVRVVQEDGGAAWSTPFFVH